MWTYAMMAYEKLEWLKYIYYDWFCLLKLSWLIAENYSMFGYPNSALFCPEMGKIHKSLSLELGN